MSPSESELRSFLHDGEGEPIDPNAVIAHARAARHNRRVRLASVAAAVVAVGAVSAGAAVLSGGKSGTPSADRRTNHGADTRATTTVGRPAPTHANPPAGHRPCPLVPLHLMVPGGGGTGQFGGDGPLFDGAVSSMQVCGYAASAIGAQVRYSNVTVISGAAAQQIATSLNAASTKQVMRNCPAELARELIIYATAQSGAAMKPVVVVYLPCDGSATNGTATRYDWTPPTDVAATLNSLVVTNPALPGLSGGGSHRVSGSPVR